MTVPVKALGRNLPFRRLNPASQSFASSQLVALVFALAGEWVEVENPSRRQRG